jgi:hypothetical protein
MAGFLGEINKFAAPVPPPKAPKAQPTAAPPAPGGTEPRTGPDPNAAWGTFGTWQNWANAFQAVHGKAPNALDERDFWDSQLYAAQDRNGEGPSNREWYNRYYTGNWAGSNPWNVNRLPYRGNGPGGFEPGGPGTPNFIDWSPRGAWASPDYQQMAAGQGLGAPYHFPVQDWAAWQQRMGAPGVTPTPNIAPKPWPPAQGQGVWPNSPERYQLPLAGGLRQNTYAPAPPAPTYGGYGWPVTTTMTGARNPYGVPIMR